MIRVEVPDTKAICLRTPLDFHWHAEEHAFRILFIMLDENFSSLMLF